MHPYATDGSPNWKPVRSFRQRSIWTFTNFPSTACGRSPCSPKSPGFWHTLDDVFVIAHVNADRFTPAHNLWYLRGSPLNSENLPAKWHPPIHSPEVHSPVGGIIYLSYSNSLRKHWLLIFLENCTPKPVVQPMPMVHWILIILQPRLSPSACQCSCCQYLPWSQGFDTCEMIVIFLESYETPWEQPQETDCEWAWSIFLFSNRKIAETPVISSLDWLWS